MPNAGPRFTTGRDCSTHVGMHEFTAKSDAKYAKPMSPVPSQLPASTPICVGTWITFYVSLIKTELIFSLDAGEGGKLLLSVSDYIWVSFDFPVVSSIILCIQPDRPISK